MAVALRSTAVRRAILLLAVLAGCVRTVELTPRAVDSNPTVDAAIDAPPIDAPPVDAAPDAAIDAP